MRIRRTDTGRGIGFQVGSSMFLIPATMIDWRGNKDFNNLQGAMDEIVAMFDALDKKRPHYSDDGFKLEVSDVIAKAVAKLPKVYQNAAKTIVREKNEVAEFDARIFGPRPGNTQLRGEIRAHFRGMKPADAVGYLIKNGTLEELEAVVEGLPYMGFPNELVALVQDRHRELRAKDAEFIAVKQQATFDNPAPVGIDQSATDARAKQLVDALKVRREGIADAERVLQDTVQFVVAMTGEHSNSAYSILTKE